MWLQRGSRCWQGSAQAWGSAPRICAALPGSNQVHWPLLGKRLFPTSLQMALKDNVRCQRHCNSHLDKEKGISVPWRGLGVRGIPKGTVRYLFPHNREGTEGVSTQGRGIGVHEIPQMFILHHVPEHGRALQKSKMKNKDFCPPRIYHRKLLQPPSSIWRVTWAMTVTP